MSEPWNAPGWQPNHDFDANAEYGEIENLPDTAHEVCDRIWQQISAAPDPDVVIRPYQVAFAPLDGVKGGGLVALYASGTESAPVVIIDWDRLDDSGALAYGDEEVAVSILHELRHGWQEAEQKLHSWQDEWTEDFDVEADAEDWARSTWQQSLGHSSPGF